MDTNAISNAEELTVDTEKQERFKKDSKERMEKICQQIANLKKLAGKRSVDYTKENIEKMFSYLEKQLAECKSAYMERFKDSNGKGKNFDFEF